MGRKDEQRGPGSIVSSGIIFREKGQILQEGLVGPGIRGDKKHGPLEPLKEPGQNISPGGGGETLKINLPGARKEGLGNFLPSGPFRPKRNHILKITLKLPDFQGEGAASRRAAVEDDGKRVIKCVYL